MIDDTLSVKTDNHLMARAWLEDGILYNMYSGEITFESLLQIEKQSVKLIEHGGHELLPAIIDISTVDDNINRLRSSDYGKLLTSYGDQLDHQSAVWIVGAKPNARKICDMFNELFLENRLQFAETLAEAQIKCRTMPQISSSILDQAAMSQRIKQLK